MPPLRGARVTALRRVPPTSAAREWLECARPRRQRSLAVVGRSDVKVRAGWDRTRTGALRAHARAVPRT